MSLTAGTGPFGPNPSGTLNFDPPERVVYVEPWPRRVLCGGNRPQACGRPAIKWKGRVLYVTRALLADRLGRPLRAGLIVAHSCDNPRCVNPSHLTEATSSQNLREAWERGRRQRRSDTPSTFTGAVEE